jgi:hypothetical protein
MPMKTNSLRRKTLAARYIVLVFAATLEAAHAEHWIQASPTDSRVLKRPPRRRYWPSWRCL